MYNSLVSLEKGSEDEGYWGDWGSMWNRIRSSSETPDPIDWSNQMLVRSDDYTTSLEDPMENGWINTLPHDDSDGSEVWKDETTGLYWSNYLGAVSSVDMAGNYLYCPLAGESYLTTLQDLGYYTDLLQTSDTYKSLISSYNAADGGLMNCGDPVNICAALELDADGDGDLDTKWYLPTQKELLQAYNDGMYLHTNESFVTTHYYWSSTSYQYSVGFYPTIDYHGDPWVVNLSTGESYAEDLSAVEAVRCVYREELESLDEVEIVDYSPPIIIDPGPILW